VRQKILILIFALGLGHSLFSATLEVLTDVNESYLGQSITLILRIVSDKPVARPQLPQITGFQLSEAGESSYDERSMGSGGSGRKVTMEYSWRLLPMQTGQLRIPVMSFDLDGETLSSNEIPLTIIEPGPLEGYHLFLTAEGDTAFPSIPLRLSLKWLFSSEVSRPDFVLPFLQNDKIRIQDLPAPSSSGSDIYQFTVDGHTLYAVQSAEIYKDEQYASLTMSWDIYPLEPGPLKLEPVILSFQRGVVDQLGRRNYKPGVIPSNPLELTIQALPDQMQSFPGGILVARNELEITASLDQTKIYPGDPLELTLQFKGLVSPALTDFKGVEGLREMKGIIKTDPASLSSSLSENNKIYHQKIRIQSSGIRSFPALSFPYYSLDAGEVRFCRSNAIPLTVMELEETLLTDQAENREIPEETGKISLRSNRKIPYFGSGSFLDGLYLMRYRLSLLMILPLLFHIISFLFKQFRDSGRNNDQVKKELNRGLKEYSLKPEKENGLRLSELFIKWFSQLPEMRNVKDNSKDLMENMKSVLSKELCLEIQSMLDHLELLWSPQENTPSHQSSPDDFQDIPEKILRELKKKRRNK
jgi:hypothetical protein